MCTLYFRHRPEDEHPLAILSNRDEVYGRKSGGWAWRGEGSSFFSPIDLEAGGTWIGLNHDGCIVALTNVFSAQTNRGFRSRGLLVVDLLAETDSRAAVERAEDALVADAYNSFNLMVAGRRTAHIISWQAGQSRRFDLQPGVYEVNNIAFNGQGRPDSEIDNDLWLEREAGRLIEHPLICRHGDGYGTRSSHKLLVHGTDVSRSRVWHLEGHPCEGEYLEVLEPTRFQDTI
jgi:uncharacterized protein with NRDE domain